MRPFGSYNMTAHNRMLGKMRTRKAIAKHEAALAVAQERQLSQAGNPRDNGRDIERALKALAKLRKKEAT